jgi:hypothetical protein
MSNFHSPPASCGGDLAPQLLRQRFVIEGTTEQIVEPPAIRAYLSDLALVADMQILSGPSAYSAHDMGYGGWVHWKTSGSHFYSYLTTPALFTIDVYTCKECSIPKVIAFTRDYFDAIDIVWQAILKQGSD